MLSDVKIRNAKPAQAAYKLCDGGGLGLFQEVTPSGSGRMCRNLSWRRRPGNDAALLPCEAFESVLVSMTPSASRR
jgi:hypothetical protein